MPLRRNASSTLAVMFTKSTSDGINNVRYSVCDFMAVPPLVGFEPGSDLRVDRGLVGYWTHAGKELPPLGMFDRLARSEPHERAKALNFKHFFIREGLEVAPLIGIRLVGMILESLYEQRASIQVSNPLHLMGQTQLRRPAVGVLAKRYVFVSELEARVGKVAKRPEPEELIGGEVGRRTGVLRAAGMRFLGRLGDDLDAAGCHHRQRPGRQLGRRGADVLEPVDHRHAASLPLEPDVDLLLETIRAIRRGREPHDVRAQLLSVHRGVIESISAREILRTGPEAMTAAD